MKSLKERFEEKIFFGSPDGCWYWTGSMTAGYGMIKGDDHINKLSHRISYQLYVSAIPKDLCVCHTCDNRLCVNPNHLFLGTHDDNMKDMVKKGRTYRSLGSCHRLSKIIEGDAIVIRSFLGLKSGPKVAKIFGVHYSTIYRIWNRQGWTHI